MSTPVMTQSNASSAEAPGLFGRIRFRWFKLLYDASFYTMVRDASWQGPLFESIRPKAHCRILSFGRGSASVARTLAIRFPEARVTGADQSSRLVNPAGRGPIRRSIPNLVVMEAPSCGRVPFDANSFDKVVLVLAFHNRRAEEKLGLAKEMLRVLRHGGTLHVAAYDKPAVPSERRMLVLTRYLAGPSAADPHLDGSWTEFLEKAGFAGIRRQSSCPLSGARISVVRARKP